MPAQKNPSPSVAIAQLAKHDAIFTTIIDSHGYPPPWEREQGFATLIHIILEQQVSLSSANAAFQRLKAAAASLTPQRFLQFSDGELKTIGFSRQKSSYGRNLAEAIENSTLQLSLLPALSDDDVRAALTNIKGIGVWTANIYLLMAMQRPDVWPKGDIALAGSYQTLKKLDSRPDTEEMEVISRGWKPYRSTAARLLWHNYLAGKT